MTLRVRLLLGYGYLIGLLLLTAVSALLGFLRLSESVDVVLEDNYATIRASLDMLEALERQDSATLAALLEGDAETGMAAHEEGFMEALGRAEGNVTEEAERPALTALRELFSVYRGERQALIAERPERPLRDYNERVFPAFQEVKHKVLQVLEINQQAMIEADRRAKATAVQNGAWLGFLVAVALVSLVFLSRALQRGLLARLDALRRGMAAIAGGDARRRLRADGQDELGRLGRHFNDLLDRLQATEARYQGRLAQERRALLGLVEALGGDGVAVYDASGRLLASGGASGSEPPVAVGRWIGERGGEDGEAEGGGEQLTAGEVEAGGAVWRLERLTTARGRPSGWLARRG
jgi:HAMP domain-containing protein